MVYKDRTEEVKNTKYNYSTKKDLNILFAWLLFYKQNNRPMDYLKCQKQIDKLIKELSELEKK